MGCFGFDTGKNGPYYTRPMSPGRSPANADIVDANLLAARGAEVGVTLQLADLPRLNEWASANSTASLHARFHLIEARVAVEGRASATFSMVCQRCLGTVRVPIEDDFYVVLVAGEADVAELPEQQDAVVADVARLDLRWLVEEQLLLAMPLVPVHVTEAECRLAAPETKLSVRDTADEVDAAVDETKRPFANLKDLLAAGKKRSGRSR